MVFPQGNFSIEAMKALKSHNFYAAVNTVPHPAQQAIRLTIAELAQPAVLRYGNFPLFIRKPIRYIQSYDVAFNLFFGRPVLIVEHHDVFRRPESLAEVAAMINSVAPEVHWSNLTTVVSNSILTRRTPNGTRHVRAYSRAVRVSNGPGGVRRYAIEWDDPCDGTPTEQVLMDGRPCYNVKTDDAGIRLLAELAPDSSQIFSLLHQQVHAPAKSLGLGRNTRAFLRRRLSEVRDNYLSKNQHLLVAAKTIQRHFLRV
jgi:hypothetical protein